MNKLLLVLLAVLPMTSFADQVDLARPDRDQPSDNGFMVQGADLATLDGALTQHLGQILSAMTPTTDDPTIRNVQWTASDQQISLTFEKQALFFWSTVTIDGSTSLSEITCPAPAQRGWVIRFNTNDPRAGQIQEYVQGIEIRICGRQIQQGGHSTLQVSVQRLLDTGPSYESWIGLLLGDFMRTAGSALSQTLQP